MGDEPILPPLRPHDQYVSFVQQGCIGIREPCRHQHVKQDLRLLDLGALRPLLSHLYSATLGAEARPPEDMLRSLLAMILCGVFSVDDWVDMMRSHPFYAVISGFDPKDVPAVGTFYFMDLHGPSWTFMDRLLDLVDNPPKHVRRPRPKRRDTASQSKDKNQDTAKHHDIINRLVNRIIKLG